MFSKLNSAGIAISFFIAAAMANCAHACELEETEFGYRFVGDDCFKLRPQDMIKMPNLVVTGAGVSARHNNGFRLSVTVHNNGTADTDSTLLPPPPSIGGDMNVTDGSFDTSVQIHIKDRSNNFVSFFDRDANAWVNFAGWTVRTQALKAGDFRHLLQQAFQTQPSYLDRFELPDIETTYDICLQAWVDPPNPTMDEIRESSELDNIYFGFARLPGRDSKPDFGDTYCFDNW